MLKLQKDKFSIPDKVTYLNGAFMSPQLKSVEKAGIAAVKRKSHPYLIGAKDFFKEAKALRVLLASFLSVENPLDIALIPSVSYGIASIANNVRLQQGDEILLLDAQFPSNVYAWQKVAKKSGASITVIKSPPITKGRGRIWNESILQAINAKTAVISLPQCHWADGTLFDLKTIRAKTNAVGALMVIDGSQSIGALPFSISELKPDAVVSVGYKWLLGPYGLGFAYMGDYFNDGEPIENNWINRAESEDFSQLVNYNTQYQPRAGRYNMGEYSNFNLVPMLTESIKQLTLWTPEKIQSYCHHISAKAVDQLKNAGCFIEDDNYRAKHLFGVYFPKHLDIPSLKSALHNENIFVSFRGDAVRVSPNVYNTTADFNKFTSLFLSNQRSSH
ncbi:aminotransferase class V-fold PLP-dependent enzyme [Flavobacteriaceae bacterium F08102]|nr:aminotransferase class V-fold PLP-dependent enzyme [Flavobacteriaceae bacterium F08102]